MRTGVLATIGVVVVLIIASPWLAAAGPQSQHAYLEDRVTTLENKVAMLEREVQALKSAPGHNPSTPAAPTANPSAPTPGGASAPAAPAGAAAPAGPTHDWHNAANWDHLNGMTQAQILKRFGEPTKKGFKSAGLSGGNPCWWYGTGWMTWNGDGAVAGFEAPK